MTIYELIEKLKKFESNLQVIVDGYEGGFTEAVVVEKRTMTRVDEQKYNGIYGEFRDPADMLLSKPTGRPFHAIRIGCSDEEHEEF